MGMTEQEKRETVIAHLQEARRILGKVDEPTFWLDYVINAVDDAVALLKRSFTPQEVYDTVIEHGQHDKRFKLGDKIDYSFTDAVDILNIELMCKAGDM